MLSWGAGFTSPEITSYVHPVLSCVNPIASDLPAGLENCIHAIYIHANLLQHNLQAPVGPTPSQLEDPDLGAAELLRLRFQPSLELSSSN